MELDVLIGQFLPWVLAIGGTALGIKFWTQGKKVVSYIGEFYDVIKTASDAYNNDGKIDTNESVEILKQWNEFVDVIGKSKWKVKL